MLKIDEQQIWKLKSGTPSIKYAYIYKFCPVSGPDFVHIAILNNQYEIEVGHVPFSTKALCESISKLSEKQLYIDVPVEGYEIWLSKFLTGGAGYFKIPVVQACT